MLMYCVRCFLLSVAMGLLMVSAGYDFTTIQFYAATILMVLFGLNMHYGFK